MDSRAIWMAVPQLGKSHHFKNTGLQPLAGLALHKMRTQLVIFRMEQINAYMIFFRSLMRSW